MKKLIALLLVLCLVFSFAACGNTPDDDDDVRGSVVSDEDKDDKDDEEEEEKEFSQGKHDTTKYENEFIGLGVKIPDDWNFYTDEQMKELNNLTEDYYSEEAKEAIENADLIYDMFASNADGSNNINIVLEKHTVLKVAAMDLKKEVPAAFDAMKESYENMGSTSFNAEMDDIEIDDKEFVSAEYMTGFNGVTLYQRQIFVKCGKYLATITVTATTSAELEKLSESFYLV